MVTRTEGESQGQSIGVEITLPRGRETREG